MGLKAVLAFYTLGSYYMMKDMAGNHRCDNLVLGQHTGEIAVVTGGHRGIGAAITKDLLTAGMTVYLGCRRIEDGNAFIASLRQSGVTSGEAMVYQLDLASLESVRAFAGQVQKSITSGSSPGSINYLINNAGILDDKFKLTGDGFESNWQVNYLSHFLLVHLLLPSLQNSRGRAVVVGMSSVTHNFPSKIKYNTLNKNEIGFGSTAYPRSKLAITMFTTLLNAKLKSVGSNVIALSAHPGLVATAIYDNTVFKYLPSAQRLLFKTPEQGAKSAVFAALYGEGGQYIGNCVPEKLSPPARNTAEQKKLFEYSKQSLQIAKFGGLF